MNEEQSQNEPPCPDGEKTTSNDDGTTSTVASAGIAKEYKASVYSDRPIPAEFAEAVIELEVLLDMKLWLLVQNSNDEWGEVSERVYNGFWRNKSTIDTDQKHGLLIHSPGGNASAAYKIARLFQRRTEEFHTVVPIYAKSAATLVAIGGKCLYMGMEAELGPLDVQIYDQEKDDYDSALNAVQSLERLNSYALTAFDQIMQLLLMRTNKKPDSLIPNSLDYATGIVRPLVEKIDTIDLTRKSRELKVAQDYAERLMITNYTAQERRSIASSLVENYSTHEFVIDRREAGPDQAGGRKGIGLGLHIAVPSQGVESLFNRIAQHLHRLTVIGMLVEEAGKA